MNNNLFTFRLTMADRHWLEADAERSGQTLSQFIRQKLGLSMVAGHQRGEAWRASHAKGAQEGGPE